MQRQKESGCEWNCQYICFCLPFNPDLCSAPRGTSLISHRFSEVSESTVCSVSHTVTKSERNYARSVREALAVVTGVMKLPK